MASRKTAAAPVTGTPGLQLGALEDNLSYLTRALRSVLQQTAQDHVAPLGLLPGEITVLSLVAANEGMSQNDLARALVIKKSQVTGLVRDLVERELIDCVDSVTDRRYNALSLTEQGQAVWKQAQQALKKHNGAALKVLTPDERKELTRMLRKLLAEHLP
ncbi:transcriptional regulator, MarR family [Ostertagia ostertagi]